MGDARGERDSHETAMKQPKRHMERMTAASEAGAGQGHAMAARPGLKERPRAPGLPAAAASADNARP